VERTHFGEGNDHGPSLVRRHHQAIHRKKSCWCWVLPDCEGDGPWGEEKSERSVGRKETHRFILLNPHSSTTAYITLSNLVDRAREGGVKMRWGGKEAEDRWLIIEY
jgi:hypothetical protein